MTDEAKLVLRRFSEPYAPTGGIASQGVKNLLGRPSIEPLELLVREALQNSWDAKQEDSETVHVTVSLFALDRKARRLLEDRVVPDPPPRLPLEDVLAADEVSLLCFADRGTCGLGGDVRATKIQSGEPSDFVDFVRNIGEPPDREFGGGSFGYGKGAFYLLSAASTIIVHTRCEAEGGLESRLIVCALGDNYNDPDGERIRRTGRHWWGVLESDVVDPAVGEAADDLARRLGLPEFCGHETGTTIGILAPKLFLESEDGERIEAETDSAAIRFVQDSVLWNFWPKMITRKGRPPEMRFRFFLEGDELESPDPDSHPQVREFANALRALDGDETPLCLEQEVDTLSSQKPKKKLGSLSLRRFSAEQAETGVLMPLAARQMKTGLNHVALLRAAEFVVDYLPGPPLPSSFVGYVGVFKCAEDLDQVFRRAEPPTHDKWESKSLEGRERTYVNVALRRIRTKAEEFASPSGAATAVADDLPIGQFASQLASLVPTLPGLGASVPSEAVQSSETLGLQRPTVTDESREDPAGGSGADSPGGGRSVTADRDLTSPRVDVVVPASPVLYQGEPVLETRFTVKSPPEQARRVILSGNAGVLMLDGAAIESDAPIGAEVPRVVRWIDPEGTEHTGTQSLVVEVSQLQKPWVMQTTLLADAAVRLDIVAEWDPE